jgi:hypothetical protein
VPDETLVLLRSPAYVRSLEPPLRELARRGHTLKLLFEEAESASEGGARLAAALAAELPGLEVEYLGRLRRGPGGIAREGLRALRDYLRYFEPPLEQAARLRARALAPVPARVERLVAGALRRAPALRRRIDSGAAGLLARTRDDPEVRAELERRRPAVLIVSPLVQLRSRQSAWVGAARGLGIPTVSCIGGWDNLTTKGLMHELPDRVAVWDELQRTHAIRLHGAPPETARVLGAWPYDVWRDRTPSRSRDELCRELGLAPGAPLLLYACSSRFVAADELATIRTWLAAVRAASGERLRMASVIVRPHPSNPAELSTLAGPRVAIFPASAREPVDDPTRRDYFDCLALADACVAINTSALIEATLAGTPAFTVPDPARRATQAALPHFRDLVATGAVVASDSWDAHLVRLAGAMDDREAGQPAREAFAERLARSDADVRRPSERLADLVDELGANRSVSVRAG